MDYLVGIDGGATNTRCLLANEEGRVIGTLSRGPANYRTQGIEYVSQFLYDSIDSLLKSANVGWDKLESVIAGLAGIREEFDRKRMSDKLGEKFPAGKGPVVHIYNDLYIALFGGVREEFGVVTNAGTGAISFGIKSSGERFISDGWGYLLGDKGSGFWIGLEAIKAVLSMVDNRRDESSLAEGVREHFSLGRTVELLDVVYNEKGGVEVDRIASLSPLIFERAKAGDKVAEEIVVQAGEELARTTFAVVDSLNMTGREFPLLLSGGVFDATYLELMMGAFESYLNSKGCSGYSIVEPDYPPVVGSLLVGLRSLNGEVTQSIMTRLDSSWSKKSF